MPRRYSPPAPKRHAAKLGGATFSQLLQLEALTDRPADELADELLARMLPAEIAQAKARRDKAAEDQAYRAAVERAVETRGIAPTRHEFNRGHR